MEGGWSGGGGSDEPFNAFMKIQPQIMTELKRKSKLLGLWNLFLPKHLTPLGHGLSCEQYAECSFIMGRSPKIAPEVECDESLR